MGSVVGGLVILLAMAAGVAVYFVPSIVAFRRNAEPRVAILVLNILFGWTFLVWIVLLIWAYQSKTV